MSGSNQEGVGNQVTPQSASPNPPAPINNNNNNQVGIVSGLINFIASVYTSIYGSLIGLVQYTLNLIRGQPNAGGPRAGRRLDPTTEVSNFVTYFESKYGSSHPSFFRGSYNSALNEAKSNLKFLLIYLHSKKHQDTDSFCTKTLIHPEVVSYINRNPILFWSINVESSEGTRVSQIVSEYSYPFLALICLRDNRMTIVRKFEGLLSVEALLSQVQQAIEDNESALVAARTERDTLSMNQQIRNAQDDEYQQSLAQDQQKEREKAAAAEVKKKEELVKREKEDEEKKQVDRLIALKSDLKSRIPGEPSPDEKGAIVKLLIKLPNGKRLERSFHKSSSIKFLYFFVFCQDESPLNFQITTNFPRKELPCKAPSLENPDCQVIDPETGCKTEPITFEQFGLGKNEMLFVHDLEA